MSADPLLVAAARVPLNRPNEPFTASLQEFLGGASSAGAAAASGNIVQKVTGGALRVTLELTNVAVAMTDAGASGSYGGTKIYDFAEGLITVLGATTNLTIAATGGIGATAAVVGALGTATAGANDTLTGTEANIVPSTACTLAASAGSFKGEMTATEFAAAVFDGTATAKDMFLNFAIPDAGSTADGTITVNGTVTFTFVNSGDN